jgi:hypothetical protein
LYLIAMYEINVGMGEKEVAKKEAEKRVGVGVKK